LQLVVGFDLEQRQIGLGIGADNLGVVLPCRPGRLTVTSSALATTWLLVTA
jgi:hypothetical protein